uniref:F-box domain-containing protein n=2 Tax=Aegilops tauschii subsp. strangulata TaxID=200361 RepID=A0A453LC56_AEGTS
LGGPTCQRPNSCRRDFIRLALALPGFNSRFRFVRLFYFFSGESKSRDRHRQGRGENGFRASAKGVGVGVLSIISMQREQRRRQTRARVPKTRSPALQQDGDSKGGKKMKYLPDLPEDIWWHIHSLMPMRDAARAACVSRTFMRSWRRHTSLTFSRKTLGVDDNVCEMDGKARDLTGKVDKIWIQHPGIGVKEVKIKFFDYKTRAYYLDRWLQIAVTPGIEELTVIPSVSKQKFNFPCSLLSEGGGNSIRCLNLYRCVFCPTVRLGLRSLTQLELFDVRITGNELACLLDNSVALQQLALMYCTKIIRLKIPSLLQRLITLEVSNCKRLQAIEIEAQCLSNFRFTSDHLVQLSFGEALQLKTLVMQCRGALCYARANIPSSLPNLETLSVYSHYEMVSTPMIGSKFPFLKHLTVVLAASPSL